MIYQSVLISIFALAEPSREEQRVTRYDSSKFGKFSTFMAVAGNGQPKNSPNMVNIYIKLLEINKFSAGHKI